MARRVASASKLPLAQLDESLQAYRDPETLEAVGGAGVDIWQRRLSSSGGNVATRQRQSVGLCRLNSSLERRQEVGRRLPREASGLHFIWESHSPPLVPTLNAPVKARRRFGQRDLLFQSILAVASVSAQIERCLQLGARTVRESTPLVVVEFPLVVTRSVGPLASFGGVARACSIGRLLLPQVSSLQPLLFEHKLSHRLDTLGRVDLIVVGVDVGLRGWRVAFGYVSRAKETMERRDVAVAIGVLLELGRPRPAARRMDHQLAERVLLAERPRHKLRLAGKEGSVAALARACASRRPLPQRSLSRRVALHAKARHVAPPRGKPRVLLRAVHAKRREAVVAVLQLEVFVERRRLCGVAAILLRGCGGVVEHTPPAQTHSSYAPRAMVQCAAREDQIGRGRWHIDHTDGA